MNKYDMPESDKLWEERHNLLWQEREELRAERDALRVAFQQIVNTFGGPPDVESHGLGYWTNSICNVYLKIKDDAGSLCGKDDRIRELEAALRELACAEHTKLDSIGKALSLLNRNATTGEHSNPIECSTWYDYCRCGEQSEEE